MVFLTLGPITFANDEIPSSINFGGDQSLSDKKLVGGRRDINAMGRIDDDISWSGMFRGATASFRARFLDGMRANGEEQTLTWSLFNYKVVIKSFKPNFHATYEIPYTITVAVVQDLNKPFPVLLPVAYNDAINNAMIEARDLAATIKDGSISAAIALLSITINGIASISNATSAVIGTISGPLNSALSTVGGYINKIDTGFFSSTNSSLFSATSTTAIQPNENAELLATDFLSFSNAYLLLAVLKTIQKNLLLITNGTNGQSITVNGANLFQLASHYYGDATLWTTIAKANGLVDPSVQSGDVVTLIIPTQTTNTNGVYTS